MKTMKRLILGATALAGLMAATTAGHAQEITLKISQYLPAVHGFQADFLEPWAAELEERSEGRVAVEIFDASSAFGKVERQADQVRAGVMDIAIGLNGIPRDRYPSAAIIEMPFLVDHADSGSRTLWQLYKEGALGSDYEGFKVLALFTHHGGLFHTVDKPVRDLGDLQGLRMRTPSPAVSAMLEYLGASPVGMPPANIYENLEKGVLDGVVTTWDLVGAIKANEVLKYHTDAGAYVAGFHVLMNQAKYDSLPDDIKAIIDDMSGDNLVAKFGDWWDKWEARGYEDAVARGNEIIEIDDETRAAWEEALQPMIEAYLDSMAEQGVENPPALYARAKELVAQYDAEREE
ncbi:TRAP transporter substrate-binding protein [Cucumibacter marinus]|uniref:TRAP transporter substrate-binding protein n=1 Tax=Cucumibacter marinus TaxID=1121252 RepID=UPI00041A7FC0|nr:TRAP transporter substrate-binding protein [Cucumibacter marinus]